ncbi:MAG: DUF4258 domain-containing protein [Bdellovibrio sp.]
MSTAKRANVIQDVIKASESGNLVPSFHAEQQMEKRDVQISDIEEMLYRAQREDDKDSPTKDGKGWKYALRGLNDNGDKDIRIIVAFNDPDTVIITVIDKNKKED